MNLNYAIFRSEPIYTLQDLAQIGSHNKREKHYKSNSDIKLNMSQYNANKYENIHEMIKTKSRFIK